MTLSAQYWSEKAAKKAEIGEPILFDSAQTEQLAEIVTARIEKAAADGTLRHTPYLDLVLIFWSARRGLQALKDYSTVLASEDSGFADLVVASIAIVYMSSSRRYSATPKFF